MRRNIGIKALCVASLLALMAAASPSPATAQTPPAKRQVVQKPKTRIVVVKRSFLDAGTEVLPGQRKFSDYAFPPHYSATAPIDYTTANIYGPSMIDQLRMNVPGHYSFGSW